jgi:hypothetical protein
MGTHIRAILMRSYSGILVERILARVLIHILYLYSICQLQELHFRLLLDAPMVPEEDKRKIKELLKKPWNHYIRGHTVTTELSKGFKDSMLPDQYTAWSHSGNTRQKYQHYYADDYFALY